MMLALATARAIEPRVRAQIAAVIALKGAPEADGVRIAGALRDIAMVLDRTAVLDVPDNADRAAVAAVATRAKAAADTIALFVTAARERALYAVEYGLGTLLPPVTGTLKLPLDVAQSMGIGTQPQELIIFRIGDAPSEAA